MIDEDIQEGRYDWEQRLGYSDQDLQGLILISEPPAPEQAPQAFSEQEPDDDEDPEIDLEQPDLSEFEAMSLHARMALLIEEDEQPEGLQYAASGIPKPLGSYLKALQKVQDATQAEINTQIRAWENGNAPYDTTQRIASILRQGALQAAQLGKLEKGEQGSLSKDEQAAVRAWMNEQKVYLKGVNRYMRKTLDKNPIPKNATDEQRAIRDAKAREAITHAAQTLSNWRMPLYVKGLSGIFEKARARFSISIAPRSGDTQCMANCYCSLEWGNDEQGAFVRWVLGQPKEDHCMDCPELAANSPYREGEL